MVSITKCNVAVDYSVIKINFSFTNTRNMSIQQERQSSEPESTSNNINKRIDWAKLNKSPVVGIIGGGQLAQMLYQAAISLGIEAHVFASLSDESAPKYFRDITRASSDSWAPSELYHFAQKCDVVTFDHELVAPSIVKELEKRGCIMLPSASTLELSANKANQRTRLSELGYSLPTYQICNTENEVSSFGERFGWPIVIKPSTSGYDGRGVFIVDSKDQVATVVNNLSSNLPLVVEPLLNLDAEGSVLAARSTTGECITYPMVKTLQIDGMCHEVTAPAGFNDEIEIQAKSIAANIASELDVIGILAVEFFIVEGQLLVNELAPRPHNTGHLSIEANVTSQFENHLRAILGLPLGSTTLRVPAAAMVNVVASSNNQNLIPNLPLALEIKGATVHLYSKSSRKNRKVGHVTATATNVKDALEVAHDAVDRLIGFDLSGQN